MNLGAIMKPLSEKIEALVELLQELLGSIKYQTEIQEKILIKLDKLSNEKDIDKGQDINN